MKPFWPLGYTRFFFTCKKQQSIHLNILLPQLMHIFVFYLWGKHLWGVFVLSTGCEPSRFCLLSETETTKHEIRIIIYYFLIIDNAQPLKRGEQKHSIDHTIKVNKTKKQNQ